MAHDSQQSTAKLRHRVFQAMATEGDLRKRYHWDRAPVDHVVDGNGSGYSCYPSCRIAE
jgi:hypothetical protein